MSHKKVLVVDDSATIREIVMRMLIDAGYNVAVAVGEEVIETVPHFAPDLILLDMWMPGMDGAQVVQYLKGNPATRNIPVIFMSGDTTMVESDILGLCVGVLEKPFMPNDMFKIIEHCMQ